LQNIWLPWVPLAVELAIRVVEETLEKAKQELLDDLVGMKAQ
jgi:hypothetical protein